MATSNVDSLAANKQINLMENISRSRSIYYMYNYEYLMIIN